MLARRICQTLQVFAAAAVLAGGAAGFALAADTAAEAPFGDKVIAALINYNRATPFIGTSGKYDPSAAAEIKALGFATAIDLRAQSEEGVPETAQAVQAAGLKYINIPVTTKAPTDDQIKEFARLVEDPSNYPILVNCHSANRVGAMWALYRVGAGVPVEVAIEEGRTTGLKPSREAAVRERLGAPAMN
jgi:uncharacterized protein (TIGR01244 family)